MNIKNEQLAEVIADMENEARKDAKRGNHLLYEINGLYLNYLDLL